LAQDPRSSVRLAAVEAPRNMRNWSPKDRSVICPWAESLLLDKRPMMATRAAALLSRCAGSSVDLLLAHGEQADKSGEFGRGMLPAYRDLCSGMRRRSGGGATKEQCARNRKLLEGLVANNKLDDQTRGLALSALAYQWPDGEALKLAKKHIQSKAPELAGSAARTVQLLERRDAAERAHQARDTGAGPTITHIQTPRVAPTKATKPVRAGTAAP
jgi:hypothetical protein